MASVEKRLPTNVPGDLFVDSTCIDCDTCRWMAPAVFNRVEGASRVFHQPETEGELAEALMALVACPTGSIGSIRKHPMKPVLEAFPVPIDGDVYHCGYHHEDSFGATSYLIVRPGGNVLVDSPRFARPLVSRLEALGGVALMFLTHRDDVADHRSFARHFGCRRLIHEADLGPGTEECELRIAGFELDRLADDLITIPVPGHTRGSTCLLYQGRYLFAGDHMAWDDEADALEAWPSVCWYSWPELVESCTRLLAHQFEWVLPGHGRRGHASAAVMRRKLEDLIAWGRRVR